MPAMLDDPTAPVIVRTSGDMPYPPAGGPLPIGIAPRTVTLRDRVTIATIVPFSAPNQVPLTLMAYLCDQLSREIEKGDTYPMIDPIPLEDFGPYWFGVFGAIVLLGEIPGGQEIYDMARQGCDWERECLGSFYIKPNYPGRSSHVCNGGFLVTDASRNRGVGRLMGETYLEWAPKLGYSYSVFNLVYETNVASCRIWDALGFKRIGRVKGCGSLKSHPGELIDAIIYGRDLAQEDDFVSEERFDKIRFYLKNGKYPNGADRAEKSRLRSAATHYKLYSATQNSPEKLMLKGKEVISDPQRQYEIARDIHHKSHGGINKTTATIAELFHWVRIKETVSQVIRNCPECSEMNKGLGALRVVQQTRYMQHDPNLPFTPLPDQADSPSSQLQLEASQHHNGQAIPYNQPTRQSRRHAHADAHAHSPYDDYDAMPVDPALMAGIQHHHPADLEDLPPSPFLAAGRGLPVPYIDSLDDQPPLRNNSSDSAEHTEDSSVDAAGANGEDRAVATAGEKLRRRLTRAGYGT
ncbi:hypothetical protein BDV95DRAFT_499294 [Massariosphaeria phaeospora]|uniref:N-acetyltransferase domain-containing protein n=1 Tax=Massariosphaeria phaeospora TaxID=100035 RepID=A0A7C8M5E0_9PLEO|nr:hypothetical protein BDV95DRAFT_499294 [Massariosphaeria phaeospora]